MKSFVLEKRLYFDDTLLTNAGELLNDKPYLLNTKEIGNNIIENFIKFIVILEYSEIIKYGIIHMIELF